MWTAITAAVVMAGLIVLARIAERALGARERSEDVADLARRVEGDWAEMDASRERLEAQAGQLAQRLDDAESTLAALKAQAATRGRR